MATPANATPANNVPVYTAAHPPTPDSALLPASIPGWGADLDPKDRPQVPKLRHDLDSGAHWGFPDRQPEHGQRERSIEHRFLTPVFWTAQPLRVRIYRKMPGADIAHDGDPQPTGSGHGQFVDTGGANDAGGTGHTRTRSGAQLCRQKGRLALEDRQA